MIMEKKKISIKLSLNKKTVVTLSNQEMTDIKGGITGTICQLGNPSVLCSIKQYTLCCPSGLGESCCEPCIPV